MGNPLVLGMMVLCSSEGLFQRWLRLRLFIQQQHSGVGTKSHIGSLAVSMNNSQQLDKMLVQPKNHVKQSTAKHLFLDILFFLFPFSSFYGKTLGYNQSHSVKKTFF